MLSSDERRQLDEMAQHLRTTDPDFVVRMGDRRGARKGHRRLTGSLFATSALLWATVPALAFIGGWVAGMVSAAVLVVAGLLVLKAKSW